MRLAPPWDQRRRPSADGQALPLINIAFLLLVYFLMAGTLLPPEPLHVEELRVNQGDPGQPAEEPLVMADDGRWAYRGEVLKPEALNAELFAEQEGPLPVKVDARSDAQQVIGLLRRLRRAGVAQVRLIGVSRAGAR
jgi:biopolymer transport protein ExbD